MSSQTSKFKIDTLNFSLIICLVEVLSQFNHPTVPDISECMVVPDDWSVVHTRFIVDHSHGVFCRRVFVGGEIYEGYVICISSECSSSLSRFLTH
jgi:hypothetical protein